MRNLFISSQPSPLFYQQQKCFFIYLSPGYVIFKLIEHSNIIFGILNNNTIIFIEHSKQIKRKLFISAYSTNSPDSNSSYHIHFNLFLIFDKFLRALKHAITKFIFVFASEDFE